MTPEQLSTAVRDVLAAAVEAGDVSLPDGVPATVVIERPRNRDHGDYATNVAMQLAKKAGTNPRALARLLAGTKRLSGTIAAQNAQFEALFEDGNLLLAELRRRREAIHAILVGTRRLADELTGLVEDTTVTPPTDSCWRGS